MVLIGTLGFFHFSGGSDWKPISGFLEYLGGGFKDFLGIFTPILGEDDLYNLDEHIFQSP